MPLCLFAQDDSYANVSFDELRTLFLNASNDSIAISYAQAYLNKAKHSGDSARIGRGYKLMANAHSYEVSLAYSDSIILFTKNLKDDRYYPAVGYYLKGAWLSELGRHKEGLDNLIVAQEHASRHNNIDQLSEIKLAIASLRDEFGEHEEALKIYRDELERIKSVQNYIENDREGYYISIYNVIDGYLDIKKPDSAMVYMREALSNLSQDDLEYYPDFLSLMGYTSYHLGEYQQALDSLNKAIPFREGYGLSVCYYYKGECLEQLGRKREAMEYFLKTDSIYTHTKEAFPKLRGLYEKLIDYARANKRVEDQITYVDRLLEVDSVLDKNYIYLSKQITKKYDTQLLLAEKNRMIEEGSQKQKRIIVYASAIILVVMLLLLFFHFKRARNIKNRFKRNY